MALAARHEVTHEELHELQDELQDEILNDELPIEYSNESLDSSNLQQPARNLSAHNSHHSLEERTDFASRRRARSRRSIDSRHRVEWKDVEQDEPHSYREWEELAREASRDEKQSARLASRRAHRAFRLTWLTTFASAILFAQLLCALYLKALATSAIHHNKELERAIANEEANIDKTQRKISLVSSDPRMATWAQKAGYRAATQNDLDDVMNPKPMNPKPLPRKNGDEFSNDEEATR